MTSGVYLTGTFILAVFLIARSPEPGPPAPVPSIRRAVTAPLPRAPAPRRPAPAPTPAARPSAVEPLERPDPLLGEAAALERSGAHGKAARLRVQAAMRRGEWAEADRRWRAIPRGLRADLQAQLWRAEISTHRGRLGDAEWIYRALARGKRARGELGVRLELGWSDVLLARGQLQAACARLRRAEAGSAGLGDLELKAKLVRRLERCRAF